MKKVTAQQLEGSYEQLQNIFGLAVKKLTEGYIAAVARGERPLFKGTDNFENLTEWKQTSVLRFRSGNPHENSNTMNVVLEIELRGLRSPEGSALTNVSIVRSYAANRHENGFVSGQWGWHVWVHHPFKDNDVIRAPIDRVVDGAGIDPEIFRNPPVVDASRATIGLNVMFSPYVSEEIVDHREIADTIAEMAIGDLSFLHEKKAA